jgi:hypothetical protein
MAENIFVLSFTKCVYMLHKLLKPTFAFVSAVFGKLGLCCSTLLHCRCFGSGKKHHLSDFQFRLINSFISYQQLPFDYHKISHLTYLEFIHSSMHIIQHIWTIHLTNSMLFCSLLLCYQFPPPSYIHDWDKYNFYYFWYYRKVKHNSANLSSTYLRVSTDVYTPVQSD